MDNNITQLRLEAVLSEYRALRDEMLQKFTHHLNIYSVVITAIAFTMGWVITNEVCDLLLAIPIVSSAFCFRYIWEQAVIVRIGNYLAHMEKNIFPGLIGTRNDEGVEEYQKLWVGWEHYFKKHFPEIAFYKHAIVILLVILPILPQVIFSSLIIASRYFSITLPFKSCLPTLVHLTAVIFYVPLGIYLYKEFWKT